MSSGNASGVESVGRLAQYAWVGVGCSPACVGESLTQRVGGFDSSSRFNQATDAREMLIHEAGQVRDPPGTRPPSDGTGNHSPCHQRHAGAGREAVSTGPPRLSPLNTAPHPRTKAPSRHRAVP